MINFGMQNRPTLGRGGGGGIEFKAYTDEHESSGVISPPLWKKTSPPTEREPLQQSHPYSHHHYRLLSPTSRSQAIARGRQELMDMVKNMPESSYELSLKDLVDHSKLPTSCTDDADARDEDSSNFTILSGKKKSMLRSGSMNNNNNGNNKNEPILLKMAFPTSLARNNKEAKKKKQKTSATGTRSKVSPRPVIEGGGDRDKDWWKKRFSVASADNQNNGSNTISGSSGSSNSSSSRNKGDFLPGCWSYFYTKKNKPNEQKGNQF